MLEKMNIVIVGHVDHGKSTVIGRLLADTNSLPEGKLEQIKQMCERNSKPFEYAFLLDALKDEQSQGITIDMARCFFHSEKRNYIIIDAPGHIEFLKNMVTGAARAEAAVLVIDANEGIQENSKRHGYLLSMLGVKQIIVCVNKMDLVDYDQNVFDKIVTDYTKFLKGINITPKEFVPVSAFEGDNIASLSDNMPWYSGNHILSGLDSFEKEAELIEKPFRMYLQDVYKFTSAGDDRRICAGRLESGSLKVGDEVIFLPSKKKTHIKSIEGFNEDNKGQIFAGKSAGFTITEQIYVKRGEMICKTTDSLPKVSSLIHCNLFWMGRAPMEVGKKYHLKIGTTKVEAYLDKINVSIDASEDLTTTTKAQIERHDVVDCHIRLKSPIAFDTNDVMEQTSRFVIVDNFEISGGGIIRDKVADEEEHFQAEALERDIRFERSKITNMERANNYKQSSAMIIVNGDEVGVQKSLAKALEEKLFNEGRFVYYLGFGNVKYGLDRDLLASESDKGEHLRRLSEVSYLMLDAGLLMIVSARDLDSFDINHVKTLISPFDILTVDTSGKIKDNKDLISLDKDFDQQKALVLIKNWLKDNNKIISFD